MLPFPRPAPHQGIIDQIQADREGKFIIAALEGFKDSAEAQGASKHVLQQVKLAEEEEHPDLVPAFDDVSGAPLDPEKVHAARMEEIEFIRGIGLYDKVPIEECWRNTGKGPITTKWIDINKGDGRKTKYRSRNVAREIARKKVDGLFAATPPLEVMKLLLSTLASGNRDERLMVADVKRAYFHAKCKRLTYVQPPPEDIGPGEENMRGGLNCSMYGTRCGSELVRRVRGETFCNVFHRWHCVPLCVPPQGPCFAGIHPRGRLRSCWDA